MCIVLGRAEILKGTISARGGWGLFQPLLFRWWPQWFLISSVSWIGVMARACSYRHQHWAICICYLPTTFLYHYTECLASNYVYSYFQPYHKAGFVSVAGATAEDDYTSQIGKDLQKRRSWLFELTLPNEMVYLLQAPNGTQRAQWSVQSVTSCDKYKKY